jgi:SAM-dependent methyltransferase
MNSQPPTGVSVRKRHALELFAGPPRHYDSVAATLSFGQDPRWRRTMVEAVDARPGERVLDVATGTGLVARALVRRCGCTVGGLDQSPEMLAAAQARLADAPALGGRFTLVTGEAERLPFADDELDHLTFAYLLRYVDDPAATLRELARVVRPGGRVAAGVSPCRRLGCGTPCGRCTRGSGFPRSAASSRASGVTPDGSWREASRSSTRAIHSNSCSSSGPRQGSARCTSDE